MPAPNATRIAAFKTLKDIYHTKKPMDAILPTFVKELDERNSAFTSALVMATLKNWGICEELHQKCLETPFESGSTEHILLILGLSQLLFMDSVPPHAAVNTTVDLSKKLCPKKSGVINAVLRRVDREPDLRPQREANIPNWIKKKLQQDYPQIEMEKFFESMLSPAPLDVRVRKVARTAEYKNIAEKYPFLSGAFRLKDKSIAITNLPGWEDGDVYVQEVSAQIPATLMKALAVEGAVADVCSAPGGKTLQLIDFFKGRKVIASDLNKNRLKQLKENLNRCHLKCDVQVMDALQPTFEQDSLAGILIDAPCSATGTTRRNPDVLSNRSPKDVKKLVELQKGMLRALAPKVKVGGILVYSTCSLFKEEGELQSDWFLSEFQNFKKLPVKAEELNGFGEFINEEGDVRTLPTQGVDGFYATRFIRTS